MGWKYGVCRGQRPNTHGVVGDYFYLAKIHKDEGGCWTEHVGFDSYTVNQVHREIATAALDMMNMNVPVDEERTFKYRNDNDSTENG